MNEKSPLQQYVEKWSYPSKRQIIIASILSAIFWITWMVTMPLISLTMTTKPLYFPEAPYWHIGLHLAAIASMSYAAIGAFNNWLVRYDQRRYEQRIKSQPSQNQPN